MNLTVPEAIAWLLALPWWQALLLVWLLWELLFKPDVKVTCNHRREEP